MAKIRVLLIEDSRLLREGICTMLNSEEDIKAIPTSGNGDALKKAKTLEPHVVLLDLALKGQDSLKVVASIKKQCPRTQVVIMDLIPAHADVVEFVRAGVSGFILKDATLDDVLLTIRSVAKGTKILPSPMTGSLFSQIVEHAIQVGKVEHLIDAVKMTKREQDVIGLIAEGNSNKEIAGKLNIAVYTVKSHVHHILEKLALHTRLELASFAHTSGMTHKASNTKPQKR